MYHIAICDDDRDYIDELEDMIRECNGGRRELCFEEYLSGLELLKNISNKVGILFLDIQMKGLDGNETAKLLREKNFPGVLVQCSGVYNPTPETIVISPYRYLLKQDPREKTLAVIDEILEEADKQNQCFVLEGCFRREEIMVKISDILYITRHRGGSSVHMITTGRDQRFADGTVYIPDTLEELEVKLLSFDFAMPHNSYLVNLRYVQDFDVKLGTIAMAGETLHISRSRKREFMERMMKYMRMKYKVSESWNLK